MIDQETAKTLPQLYSLNDLYEKSVENETNLKNFHGPGCPHP
jgi:hypothetical protein